MKKFNRVLSVTIAVLMIFSAVVAALSVNAVSYDNADAAASASYNLAEDVQSGQILHAWNCSYNNIKKSLSDIAEAGFSTVQLSPVQPPKDYNGSWTDVDGQWWKMYQPLGFCVASKSWLGTKAELASLCSEAHSYGIKIIVDVVCNHMANNGSDTYTPNVGIKTYEPEIYNNQSTYFHAYENIDYSSRRLILQGNMGMPDLNTADEFIQQRVISLLKECIDCGVDGFRFDAAKHIETPSDGSYASDFWPNITSAASEYAMSAKSKSLYFYGEILSPAGPSRSFSYYTPYMSITDNRTGDKVTSAMQDGKASAVATSSYDSGVAASKLVLWAESHDTYTGDSGSADYKSTKSMSQLTINKSYCFSASRKGSASLYFIRPAETNAKMGQIGTTAFKNPEIAAVNKFHNHFIGKSEYLSSSGNIAVSERGSSSKAGGGIVLVNCAKEGTTAAVKSITTHYIADGKYVDEISGNIFTVSSGKISGTIGETGVAVIYNTYTQPTEAPTQAGTLYYYGDINLNGEVTIMDVTLMQRYLAEFTTLNNIQLKAADVNHSGDVTIIDATVIQRKLAELISAFPSGESFRM